MIFAFVTLVFVWAIENLESHGILEIHFQAWKVIKFKCGLWIKSWKIFFGRI